MVVLVFISLFVGIIFGGIYVDNSVRNKARVNFELWNDIIFLNGTVSKIQFNFDDDIWITIENNVYNLGDIYRSNDYVNGDGILVKNKNVINELLNDLNYLLSINDIITIYNTGRTVINDREVLSRVYTDLANFEFSLVGTLTLCAIGLYMILFILTYFACYSIFFMKDKKYYKEKSEKYKKQNK